MGVLSPRNENEKCEDKEKRAEFRRAVGQCVRDLRNQKKWTQEMLAEKARINGRYLYEIETGKKCMTIWTLAKLSKALDVSIDKLLSVE
jgi:ribosome-binding protein aMBF1 (putative translation factor)